MKLASEILSLILPVFYLVVIYVYYRIFFGKQRHLSRLTVPLLLGLVLLHSVEIIIRLIGLKAMLFSTAFDALSFLAFSILIVYIIIERTTKSQASGLFIMSFSCRGDLLIQSHLEDGNQ